jgi:hypothetical protein
MINGDKFAFIVKAFFDFLITDFNFHLSEEIIRGNVFYEVRYRDVSHLISISYENIEDYLQIIVFTLNDGNLPDYDDKNMTKHLNKLTSEIMVNLQEGEFELNNKYFANIIAKGNLERRLLKSAKDLRLCMKYLIGLKGL